MAAFLRSYAFRKSTLCSQLPLLHSRPSNPYQGSVVNCWFHLAPLAYDVYSEKVMRAMQLTRSSGGLVLIPSEIPQPVPTAQEILVAVHAAGVTPSELLWYPTGHHPDGTERRNAVPGHEFSGTVVEVGPEVQEHRVGDAVFGMNDWFAEGATADFCLTGAEMIASKPASLTHQAAATVPIAALTARQGLDRARLKAGERLLVHGASGSVGAFVVQMAAAYGAHVIGTASGATLEFVRGLGAFEVLDYKTGSFESFTRNIDVIFDCVGGETLQRSWQLLAPGGRLVTIAAASEQQADQRVKDAFFIVEPNRAQLVEAAEQLAAGSLKTFVKATVPFEQAELAYTGTVSSWLPYGKLVLAVVAD